jgi:opacity protein-like surface antigen
MLGLSRKFGPGVATMEITYIDQTLLQLGIGYSLDITENLSVGAEVRHTHQHSGERDTAVFVRVTVRLGSSVGKDEHDHGHEDENEDEHDHKVK